LSGLEEGLEECSADDIIRAVEELNRKGTPPKSKKDVYDYITRNYSHCSKLGMRAFYYRFEEAERGVRGRRVVKTPDGYVVVDGHKDVVLKACRLVLCLTQPEHEPDVELTCRVLKGELYEQSGGRLGEVVEMALEHVITARGERVEVAKEIAKILRELREARERLNLVESEVDRLIREEDRSLKLEYVREIDSILGPRFKEHETRTIMSWREVLRTLAFDIPEFLSDVAGYAVEGYELREACLKAIPTVLGPSNIWRVLYETFCKRLEALTAEAPITYSILQVHMRMRTAELKARIKGLKERLEKLYSKLADFVGAFYRKSIRAGFIEGWCEDCMKGFVSDEVKEAIRDFVKVKIEDKIKADPLTTLRSRSTLTSY
jgi:hypothetical protein